MGYANIYSLADVASMSHIALEMYTTNAVVLWGTNPFPLPTREDFAEEAALNIESVGRYARHLAICYWRTSDEITGIFIPAMMRDLRRLMQTMVALRTGTFPKNQKEFRQALQTTPDGTLLTWLESLRPADQLAQQQMIASRVNAYVNNCVEEIASFR
jgi:hypothetical protein